MTLVCEQCGETLGTVEATARLVLTVHCPYCGFDFGVAAVPPEQAKLPVDAGSSGAPAGG